MTVTLYHLGVSVCVGDGVLDISIPVAQLKRLHFIHIKVIEKQ